MTDKLKVTDTTAQPDQPARIHEVVVGERIFSYPFKYHEPIEMPFAHAMKFVPIPSFIVEDEKGERVIAAPKTPDRHSTERLVLQADEVVAKVEELTIDALLKRVLPLRGGEKFKKQDGKAAIAAFLVAHRRGGEEKKASAAKVGDDAQPATVEVSDMTARDVDKILGFGDEEERLAA